VEDNFPIGHYLELGTPFSNVIQPVFAIRSKGIGPKDFNAPRGRGGGLAPKTICVEYLPHHLMGIPLLLLWLVVLAPIRRSHHLTLLRATDAVESNGGHWTHRYLHPPTRNEVEDCDRQGDHFDFDNHFHFLVFLILVVGLVVLDRYHPANYMLTK
jgi:hypothetical protein